MLRLIENKPRRQRGKIPSVRPVLVLATLLFASAAVLYPLVDTGRLPTVHRGRRLERQASGPRYSPGRSLQVLTFLPNQRA
jgi:hypothetical protein